VTLTYIERLAARTAAVGSVLCLGLDPDPARLPAGFSPDVAGVERFVTLVIETAGPSAAAIKPNLAFYEALGSEGMAALERIRARIPADIPVVIDAKRADIGSTAARHAVAIFDRLGADAVTVNPYPGGKAIEPLLERTDRYAYVLCRTSNPEAATVTVMVESSRRSADLLGNRVQCMQDVDRQFPGDVVIELGVGHNRVLDQFDSAVVGRADQCGRCHRNFPY